MIDDKLPAGWDMTYSVRRFYRVRRILELSEECQQSVVTVQ
jgi:hypothetical protein